MSATSTRTLWLALSLGLFAAIWAMPGAASAASQQWKPPATKAGAVYDKAHDRKHWGHNQHYKQRKYFAPQRHFWHKKQAWSHKHRPRWAQRHHRYWPPYHGRFAPYHRPPVPHSGYGWGFFNHR